MHLIESLKPGARVSGKAFALWGLALFSLKFFIDHLLATRIFERPWGLLDYLAPGLNILTLISSARDRPFLATMMAVAIPFVVIGILLTANRLRDANVHRGLLALFFVPVLNVLFFAILIAIPRRIPMAQRVDAEPLDGAVADSDGELEYGHDATGQAHGVAAWWPKGTAGSMWLAAILAAAFACGFVLLSANFFQSYGFGLFVGAPFIIGFLASSLHSIPESRTAGQSVGVATLASILTVMLLIVFALEGIGCLLMLLPLACPLVLLGAGIGWAIFREARSDHYLQAMAAPTLALALLMLGEQASPIPAPLYVVTTSVEINAPPEAVWQNVIAFPQIPEPGDLLFRAGIAYPIRATITGHGVGAIRECVFSTGAFIEPVTVWDEARLLRFDVTENPPALREWSLYKNVHAPHVANFLISRQGEFRLIDLGGGRTRLEGTTWYQHNLWPAGYWRFWSDAIIHRIHLRVLNHIGENSAVNHP